jgi:mono/diheme cytochrome c family protein
MKLKLFIGLVVFLSIAAIYSCRHLPPELPTGGGTTGGGTGGGGTGGGGGTVTPPPVGNCSPDTVYFQNTILPLINSSCAMSGCHDATTHKSGVTLTTYANISGLTKPGNPASSKLYTILGSMPPSGYTKLTAAQKASISTWITQGSKNNSCTAGCDTTLFTYSGAVAPIFATYCVGCHSATLASGGVNLSTYAGAQAAVAGGKLVGDISWASGFNAMPVGGTKLAACQITQITKWVNAGAPNN